MKKNVKKTGYSPGQTQKNPSSQLRNIDRIWIVAIAIAVISFLIYLPALQNGFLVNWDEDIYIIDNEHIRSLNLDFFRWAFLDYKTNLWHPVTWISHAIDHAIWGLNPFGHHLTSILFHSLNTGIVVLLVNRLILIAGAVGHESANTGTETRRTALVASAVTGLLFAIHPLHVESVAWVTERKDLLYSMFYILSIFCYLRYATDKLAESRHHNFLSVRTYQLSLFLFILSLASKPMAVTLPLALLLLDWYPLQRLNSKINLYNLILEKIPFFLLSALISLITIIAQRHHSTDGMMSLEKSPPLFRIFLAMKSMMLYCLNIIVPHNLLPIYFYPQDRTIWKPEFVIAAGFIIATTTACIAFRKTRVIPASLLFFTISLFPVLGLTQTGVQAMADRFAYLASLSLFLLIGIAIDRLWWRSDALQHRSVQTKTVILAFTLSGMLYLAFVTHKQIGIWKDAVTLWSYAIQKSKVPDQELYIFRADALEKSGNHEKAQEDYAKALSINPKYPGVYSVRGINHKRRGNYPLAIEDFNMVIQLAPDDIDTYINRGNAYLLKGDSKQAIKDYTHAIERKAKNAAVAYVNRSNAYANAGEFDKAIQDVTTAISLNKELLSMYVIRGNLNMKVGNFEQGMKDYKTACDKGLEEGCRKAVFPF